MIIEDYKVVRMIEGTKSAAVTAAATTGLSLGTVLEWIPDAIGKLGTLVGIILSIVLIAVHIRRYRMDSKKHRLETELLKARIKNERDKP